MKALLGTETETTVIVKLDNGLIIEFQKNHINGLCPFQISTLSAEQFELLGPYQIDGMVMNVIENNRNSFDSLFSNLD